MPETPLLPPFIKDFVSGSSMEQRKALLLLLEEYNEPYLTADSASDSCHDIAHVNEPIDHSNVDVISPFIVHVENVSIDEELSDNAMEELSSLKLRTKGKKGKVAKVKTLWLTPNSENFNLGNAISNSKPLNNYPAISKIMDLVNQDINTSGDMNACLISCMSSKECSLRYHSDNESFIDQRSDICTISFGPDRTLDFVSKTNNPHTKNGIPLPPEYTVPAIHHSLNIMKAGCQSKILHRIPPGNIGGVRYSLSFRKVLPQTPEATASLNNIAVNCDTPRIITNSHRPKKKISLLAGDSYFARLDAGKLGKGKQAVYNISKGGSKVDAVLQSLKKFDKEHPELEVKKLFLSIGTNDIRNCHERGVYHLKTPVQELLSTVINIFPHSKVYVQSLLPIPSNGNRFSERNVLSMNNLIFNLCSKNKIFFVDAFTCFLNRYGNRNLHFFPKYDEKKNFFDIHPNPRGMGILARKYIFLIHSTWFNPMAYN